MKVFIHNLKYRFQIVLHYFGWHVSRYRPLKYSEDTFEIQKQLLNKSPDVIFDVGAWVGKTSEKYLDSFPEAIVHAFEPFPQSFEKLEDRFKSKDRVVRSSSAVSANDGQAVLHSNNIETTNSLLASKSTNSEDDFFRDTLTEIHVETITLDTYCEENQIETIDILKIDTQGNELEVLKGAHSLLKSGRIQLIYCEVSFIQMYEDCPLYHEIAVYLEQFQYKLHSLYGLVKNEKGEMAWGDAIFCSNTVNA